MTASFDFEIRRAFTSDEGGMVDVVKEVEVDITGTQGDHSFVLSQSIKFDSPDPNNFIAFSNLTKDVVKSWINSSQLAVGQVRAVKAHIQLVLDEQAEKSGMSAKSLPWVAGEDVSPAQI